MSYLHLTAKACQYCARENTSRDMKFYLAMCHDDKEHTNET